MGHWDLPLSPRGLMQAKRLAERIADYPIDRVATSDMIRCRQTAEEYVRLVPHLPIVVTGQLRECSFGRWEGQTFDEIQAADPDRVAKWVDDPWIHAPPEGESLRDLDRRLSDWLAGWEKRHGGTCTAVFSHGGPIRWFLAKCVYRDWNAFWNAEVPHGGGWLVEKVGERWLIQKKIGKEREEDEIRFSGV